MGDFVLKAQTEMKFSHEASSPDLVSGVCTIVSSPGTQGRHC